MISVSSNTCPATAVSTYAARSVSAKPAEQTGVRSGGNDLDRDVRQASDAREVGELAFGNACDANV